jgi:hypothetical protein
MLDAGTDYAQGVSAITSPTNNLRINGSQTIDSPIIVNSLLITDDPLPVGIQITGSGNLSITSGAILTEAFGVATISTPINFGSAEGILYTEVGADLKITGTISGSGGLTIAGRSTVLLEGDNTFTGPMHLARAGIYFSQTGALGPDTSPIRLDGSYIYYNGPSDATLIRSIEVSSAGASLGNGSNTGSFTVAGSISGPGQLSVGGYDVLLTGNNSFSGGLRVNASGTVRFSSDASLGSGDITFGGGNLEPTFNWTTNRTIYPYFNGGLSSGIYDVQLNGPILGNGGLRKYGSGSMTLRDVDQYEGDISVLEGAFAIDGFLPAGQPAVGGDRITGGVGTTLAGNGLWNRRVTIGGVLSPGPGIATLTTSEVAFAQDSSLQIEIVSADSFDRLIVGGNLSLAPLVNLALTLGYDPVDFVDRFTIVTPVSVSGLPPRFTYLGDELSEGEAFLVGSQFFQISYLAGDGNDIELYAAPEPTLGLTVAVGLACFVGLRRRR